MATMPKPGSITCKALARIADCRIRLVYGDARIGMYEEHPEYANVEVVKVVPVHANSWDRWSSIILDATVGEKL